MPPSITTIAYEWVADRSPFDLPPGPPPDWLVDLLADQPTAPASDQPFSPEAYRKRADRYAWRAFESELALIATAIQGRRNDRLNASAHALYRLVASGQLIRVDVDEGLIAAARHVGLLDREITATIASAARARGILP